LQRSVLESICGGEGVHFDDDDKEKKTKEKKRKEGGDENVLVIASRLANARENFFTSEEDN
jgi:hypothetical protein